MSIHDWLVSFTGESYLWQDYGSSLVEVIKEKTRTLPPDQQSWIAHLFNSAPTNKALLYRYYLLKQVMLQNIDPQIDYPHLYTLMATTLLSGSAFSPLPANHVWEGIDDDPQPINKLRLKQREIHEELCVLIMHDHIHPDHILDDHGVLTSLSLLYGMYLVYVILIFEATLNRTADLQRLTDAVKAMLLHSKGALCHGPNQWHEADVR